tara:strand:- start:2289 stop:2768 length:480 start_codon:yes stop_codon:yes gene_type:complete
MLGTDGKDIAMLSKRVKDGILQSANGTAGVANCNTMWQPQHLYITTDEKIKDEDWVIENDKVYQYKYQLDRHSHDEIRKIIATTCWYNAAKAVLRLPQIPQSFIEEYCNNPVDEIWIEVEEIIVQDAFKRRPDYNTHRIKLNSNNEIILTEGLSGRISF